MGEAAIAQIPDSQLHWQYNEASNSVYVIVKHISGNMLSRFTDFLSSDGEKPWRERDKEFEDEGEIRDSASLMIRWEEAWQCLFEQLKSLTEADLEEIVYIRKEPHTVIEALNRQLGHYAYHVGQMVFLGKMICEDNWQSLSIPKGRSEEFNKKMFSKNDQR